MNKSAFFILLLLCLAWPSLGTLRAGTLVRIPAFQRLSVCTLYGRSAAEQSTNQCMCAPGFGWNSAKTSCVAIAESCKQQFGPAATADETGSGCTCADGYAYDQAAGTCESLHHYCASLLGPNGSPLGSNACGCMAGYSLTANLKYCVPDFGTRAW